MNTTKKNNFIDIQLFGESNGENNIESNNDVKNIKTIEKTKFDSLASENSTNKKRIRELESIVKEFEDKNKTQEELANEKLAEKEAQILEKNRELNILNAKSSIMECKSYFDKEDDFEKFINLSVRDSSEETKQNALFYNDVLKKIYEKGLNDAKEESFKNSGNELKKGSINEESNFSSYLNSNNESRKKISFN